ncbi:acyltransferase [Erythrobacter sp. JGD-13]|uniref:Acyltransferase n=1 Tax=Aurantiacibacter sediminis TaxID=2793064 RepID=A0ABS0MZS5_9SPHN|nr:acyltransferase [Aurantiacibacter sediminis]
MRGIAAWFVVLYHARLSLTDWVPDALIDVFAQGYLAVDLFFMLSGFVMWLNYGPRLRESGLAGAPDFWWRRVARIWPLHIAVLLAMVGFALLLLATGRSTEGYPFVELPLHVLLLQNWGFTDALSWNHPAWSISAELGAYVLFPFIVLAARWEILRAPAFIAVIIGCALLLAGIFTAFGATTLGGDITRLGLIRCVLQFIIGMMLALLWLRWRDGEVIALWPAILGCMLVAAWIVTQRAQVFLLPLGFAACLLALALSTGPVAWMLGGRVFEWLGDISYSTYLIHFPLFILAKIFLADDRVQIGPGGFALYCVALLILSHCAYRLLEKPAQRALNRFAPSKRRRAVPAE